MESKTAQKSHPWSNLSTITTFDRGNRTNGTTFRIENTNGSQVNRQVIERVTPSTSLLIESLIKQLCTMLDGDTLRRNKLYFAICDKLHEVGLIDSSYNAIEYESIRGQYQHALYQLVAVARAATGSESPLQVPSCLMTEWSRYRREFIEICFIAHGGFGNVYKALHRLDGIEYAIKKIVVQSGQLKNVQKHLEEVKSLAKLNHTNIVPYKTAWIEPTLPTNFLPRLPFIEHKSRTHPSERIEESKSSSSCANKSAHNNLNSDNSQNSLSLNKSSENNISILFEKKATYKNGMYSRLRPDLCTTVNQSTGGYIVTHDIINQRFCELNTSINIIGKRIIERSTSSIDRTQSDIVSFRYDSKNETEQSENNTNDIDHSDSNDDSSSDKKICQYNSQMVYEYATLYIQMALCEKTLRQWLNERNSPSLQTVTKTILIQILRGVDYIHSLNIVHHDIKPSNLFISTSGNLQIQLGDFGLACLLQRDNHHAILGTHMYAAPEQLQGECNPKSDMYSVGIVLIELLIYTTTQMELSNIINDLKNGQIPTALMAEYPQWATIVSQLVEKDPVKRPSTNELLQSINEDKDKKIAELKDELIKRDNLIQELQEKILSLQAQVMK